MRKRLILPSLLVAMAANAQVTLDFPDGFYHIGNFNQMSQNLYYMYDTDATKTPYGNAVDYNNPAGRNGEHAYAYASTLQLSETGLQNFTYYVSRNADGSYTIQSCAATGHTFMDVAPYDRQLIRFSAQPGKTFRFKNKSAYTDQTWGEQEYVVGQLRNAAIADSVMSNTTSLASYSFLEEVEPARITAAFSVRPALGRAKGALAMWPAGNEPGQVSPLLSANLTNLIQEAETMITNRNTTQEEADQMSARLKEAAEAYQQTAPEALNPVVEGYYFVQSAYRAFEDRQSKLKAMTFEAGDPANLLAWNTLNVNDGSMAMHITPDGEAFSVLSHDGMAVCAPRMDAERDQRTLTFSSEGNGAKFLFTPDTEGMWKMACSESPNEFLFANNNSVGLTGLYGKKTNDYVIASGSDWLFPGFCASWYLHRAYHEVKVLSSGWASMATSFPVEVPEGVDVYTVRQEGETLYLKPYTASIIPAHTGVIIKAEKGTYTFLSTTETVPAITDNALLANCTATKVAASSVALIQVKNGEAGMSKSSSTSLAAGVAYVPYTEGQETFRPFKDDPDGIDGVQQDEKSLQEGTAYDLSGRPANKNQRGIKIINGKKIMQ